MTDSWIGGYDMQSTFGALLWDEDHVLDAMVEVPQEVMATGVRGAIFTGPNGVKVREFTLKYTLDGASRSATQTALQKLQALVGGGVERSIRVNDWSDVSINAVCMDFQALPVGPHQVAIPIDVEMRFRAANPYWQSTSASSITFNTTHTDMPQGTAPSEPVLTSAAAALTTPELRGYDHNDVLLWSCTLASLLSGERYRITTARYTMTIEKYTGGNWTSAEGSITAGIFPRILPSDGVAYQTGVWPKLYASTGTWTADFNKQWR